MPRVTVVMAVYNASKCLREAVTSILEQTYSDFELIVVDDSSSDDSLSVLRGFRDPRVRIIKHQTNMGAAASRNDAMLAARGEFIAIMDADDVCAPNRIERQVAFLDANPRVGLVGCGVYDNIDVSGGVLYTTYLPADNQSIQRTILKRWCFLHSSIVFRRTVQQRVGGYRDVFVPAEDHDFVLRVLEHCEAHNLREPLVSYRLNPKGLTVVGHRKVEQLREVAVRLALRRRNGQSEDLNVEMASLLKSMGRRTVPQGVAAPVQAWRNSLFAAQRYYEFGCLELCAGHPARARLCFLRSLQTNILFLKSWFAFALSVTPFAADLLKCASRVSMQHRSETASLRRSAKRYSEQRAAIVESTPSTSTFRLKIPSAGLLVKILDFYYLVKPTIPHRIRLALRAQMALRQRQRSTNVWPINESASRTPTWWPGWPGEKAFAFVLTHDVEGRKGIERCRALAELERGLGFRSSFNFVPEGEYKTPPSLRSFLDEQGFEIGVHDLHHDGRLYRSKATFRAGAARINEHLRRWQAVGFRSAFMFHNLEWLKELNVLYDASTFDSDPFEPQSDGANTIFPFWVERSDGSGYVELPYTLPQDSTLFLILGERTNDIWKRKLDWVARHGGLALVNVHPDYIAFTGRACRTEFPVALYEDFLAYVSAQYGTAPWYGLPRDIAHFVRKSVCSRCLARE